MRKPLISRFSKKDRRTPSPIRSWLSGADPLIHGYARSLQNAARILIERSLPDDAEERDGYSFPIILLYREAIEIHLKLLVGEGSNFLKTRTDPISLSKTHSLRWLAQIVCQIIKAVGWQADFHCAGVSTLADFNDLVDELESLDPIDQARYGSAVRKPDSRDALPLDIPRFANRMDALISLLDATADALAATWAQYEGEADDAEFPLRTDYDPTIQ
jgi:hypothetical protein